MKERILIYSAGGFGREVAWLIQETIKSGAYNQIVGFIEDNPSMIGTLINGIEVISFDEAKDQYNDCKVLVGIGNPQVRQKVTEKCLGAGFEFTTVKSPDTKMSDTVKVGSGSIICAGNIITVNIDIREHVHINLDCTIGHDVIMGEYTTLTPGVHVSGWVHLGKRVYIGTGATIVNGTQDKPLVIGDDAVIGSAACVTKDVESGSLVVGVPARPMKKG